MASKIPPLEKKVVRPRAPKAMTRAEKAKAKSDANKSAHAEAMKNLWARQREVREAYIAERKNTVARLPSPATSKNGKRVLKPFSDEQVLQAFELMAQDGDNLPDACRILDLNYNSVQTRIDAVPHLKTAYTRARENFVRNQVQRMNIIALEEPDVQRARLLCDNTRWEASKVIPKEYGDKTQHTGDGGGPIGFIDAAKLAAMSDAELKVLEASLAKLAPTEGVPSGE